MERSLPAGFEADIDAVEQQASASVQLVSAGARGEVEVELIGGEGETLNPNDIIAGLGRPDVRQAIDAREVDFAHESRIATPRPMWSAAGQNSGSR